jgi:serine/threonine-protein kinase RsbW
MAATGGVDEQGISTSVGPPAPAARLRWRRVFRGEERQLSVMRRWLATLLPDCPARDDVATVATELASNAVRHTASGLGGWFSVEVTWHRSAVRVAVTDGGAPSGPRMIDDPEGEHGRGLLVVHGLSAHSGTCGDERGRMVWADVFWGDDAGAAEPGTPQDRYEAAIQDGLATLASHFARVPIWFGRSTLQWWAMAGGELVAAPSAQELASLLGRVLDYQPLWPPAARDTASEDARAAQAGGGEQRPGISALQYPSACASLPQGRRDAARPGGHGGPPALKGGCRPDAKGWRTVMSGGLVLPVAASSSC